MTKSTESSNIAIAVIGIGCCYPGAHTILQFWENVLARRQQFRSPPDVRLPLSEYYDPDPQTPDKSYGSRMAVIDGFEFDWVKHRIPKGTVESTDIVHWLALDTAEKALKDAGYSRETVPTHLTGVIVGNTLTGEQTRAETMRLRWPFVRKTLRAAAEVKGLPPATRETLVETMEKFYKSVFAPITEDSLAGGLSNTIAGRICNFFNLDGGGYTVDGACSSSLIAVADACTKLASGELNLALAGGVDVSLDTFELIGFAKTSALTASELTVYDRRASGFIPGEGCGFVVVKRLEDALRDGDYVYGTINGWGISSDGKGGLTAPSKVGQSKALLRAYQKAGYSAQTLDFIEGHGTGTPKGDRTELEGIALAMSQDNNGEITPRSIGMTSFKSIVGHTKAASGIGGFIKALIAVNQRILPPTAGCQEPNPIFDTTAQCLYPILTGEIRQSDQILKAGVFGAGFGGINCHVAISSGDAPATHLKPNLEEQALLVSNQDTEIFILSAISIEALLERTKSVIELAKGMSMGEMVDLAAKLAQENQSSLPIRAAIIASGPDQLRDCLVKVEQMLNNKPPAKGEVMVSPQKHIYISNGVKRNRVAYLFPGQGSQKLNMARKLVQRYGWARQLVTQADQWLKEIGLEPVSQYIYRPLERAANQEQVKEWSQFLARTIVAQPSLCLASLIWMRYLKQLGIEPVAVGGHSLGELTAFYSAGAYDEKTLICLVAMRGQVMSASPENAGTMASLGCSQAMAESILQQVNGYVIVANINSPTQTVISGDIPAVEQAVKLAQQQNIQTHLLRVTNAFHSEKVQSADEYLLANAPIPEQLTSLSVPLFSSTNGEQIKAGINLKQHFANQVISQVDFISLVERMIAKCDLMVEVGSGRVLSGLVSAISNSCECFPLESKPGRDSDLNSFLATLFVYGGEIKWEALYENRLVRPFIPASAKKFIENPCERSLPVFSAESSTALNNLTAPVTNSEPMESYSQLQQNLSTDQQLEIFLSNYFSERGEFLAELIKADLNSLLLF
jgi:acyl transferase domain-containing protein